jgi:hypothetical protein
MTMPAPHTLEREKDKLYLLDAELIRRLGVPEKVLRPMLPGLERTTVSEKVPFIR